MKFVRLVVDMVECIKCKHKRPRRAAERTAIFGCNQEEENYILSRRARESLNAQFTAQELQIVNISHKLN